MNILVDTLIQLAPIAGYILFLHYSVKLANTDRGTRKFYIYLIKYIIVIIVTVILVEMKKSYLA